MVGCEKVEGMKENNPCDSSIDIVSSAYGEDPVDHLITIRCLDEEEKMQGLCLTECRICQEEEEASNLDAPCACSGSVKYAHRQCLQRWCNEKGDTVCEICQQPYKGGYKALPRPTVNPRNTNEWAESGQVGGSRVFTFDAADYDDFPELSSITTASCRSCALILLVLMLLQHALAMSAASLEEDSSVLFLLLLLRAFGVFLPCCIMARIMTIYVQRRQQEEEEQQHLMAVEEVAMIIESGQARNLNFPSLPALP